jgi:hypothetical protein
MGCVLHSCFNENRFYLFIFIARDKAWKKYCVYCVFYFGKNRKIFFSQLRETERERFTASHGFLNVACALIYVSAIKI